VVQENRKRDRAVLVWQPKLEKVLNQLDRVLKQDLGQDQNQDQNQDQDQNQAQGQNLDQNQNLLDQAHLVTNKLGCEEMALMAMFMKGFALRQEMGGLEWVMLLKRRIRRIRRPR